MPAFEQILQQRVTAVRQRDPRLDEDAAIAKALNDDPALYAQYRQTQWPLPAAEPEPRPLAADSLSFPFIRNSKNT